MKNFCFACASRRGGLRGFSMVGACSQPDGEGDPNSDRSLLSISHRHRPRQQHPRLFTSSEGHAQSLSRVAPSCHQRNGRKGGVGLAVGRKSRGRVHVWSFTVRHPLFTCPVLYAQVDHQFLNSRAMEDRPPTAEFQNMMHAGPENAPLFLGCCLTVYTPAQIWDRPLLPSSRHHQGIGPRLAPACIHEPLAQSPSCRLYSTGGDGNRGYSLIRVGNWVFGDARNPGWCGVGRSV